MRSRSRRLLIQGSVVLTSLGLLSGCDVVSLAAQRPVLRRIGFLESGANPNALEPFREGLRDLGYIEGQHLLIEHRSAERNVERLPVLAAELVDLRVNVIVAREPGSATAASRATSTIPIVVAGGDIVASGLVTNIARPEGNVTGVTTNIAETVGKWVDLLKDAVPSISRLAVTRDPTSSSNQASLELVRRAAQTLQYQLTPYDLRDFDQLAAVLSTIKADGADGLVMLSGAFGPNGDPRIGNEVLRVRLPAVAEARAFAVNGGLLAHGTRPGALATQTATYVDKILKGAKPGDLPIALPTEFHIVVNIKAAQELGLTIPPSVLQQATEVIQ